MLRKWDRFAVIGCGNSITQILYSQEADDDEKVKQVSICFSCCYSRYIWCGSLPRRQSPTGWCTHNAS